MKYKLILTAGSINLFTAFLHLIGGQISLVHPLIESTLNNQIQAEWIGAWHMVTILLFFTSFILLKSALKKSKSTSLDIMKFIGWLYILFSIPSVITSVYFTVLAPQWILLAPIGLLIVFGIKNENR